MQRIAFFSDTHVSAKHGFFVENALATIAAINALQPDLVVHGGDLSVNGAEDADDLAFSARLLKRVAPPLAIIPGNHDIGEEPHALHLNQPIDAARIARYRAAFGADWWVHDLGVWRIIGLNSLLIGSGLGAEKEQRAWTESTLAAARPRPIGVFLHKPLQLESPEEAGQPEWTIDPRAREDYRTLFMEHGVRLVGSGHLHQSRARLMDGMLHVWAPSCGFVFGKALGGEQTLGFSLLELSEDGAASARFVRPAALVDHDYAAIKGNGRYRYLNECPPAPWRGEM